MLLHNVSHVIQMEIIQLPTPIAINVTPPSFSKQLILIMLPGILVSIARDAIPLLSGARQHLIMLQQISR